MAHHSKYGGLAQLGERLPCKQEVTGSIPVLSTIKKLTEAAKKFEVSLSFLKEKLESRKGSGTSNQGNEVKRSVDIRRRCTLKTEHCLIMMQYYEKATVKENFFN